MQMTKRQVWAENNSLCPNSFLELFAFFFALYLSKGGIVKKDRKILSLNPYTKGLNSC